MYKEHKEQIIFKTFENDILLNVDDWVKQNININFVNKNSLSSDCPSNISNLEIDKTLILLSWINKNVSISKRKYSLSSYGLKHVFERDNFYITHGQFKGAMLMAGFVPCNNSLTNWQFKIKVSV